MLCRERGVVSVGEGAGVAIVVCRFVFTTGRTSQAKQNAGTRGLLRRLFVGRSRRWAAELRGAALHTECTPRLKYALEFNRRAAQECSPHEWYREKKHWLRAVKWNTNKCIRRPGAASSARRNARDSVMKESVRSLQFMHTRFDVKCVHYAGFVCVHVPGSVHSIYRIGPQYEWRNEGEVYSFFMEFFFLYAYLFVRCCCGILQAVRTVQLVFEAVVSFRNGTHVHNTHFSATCSSVTPCICLIICLAHLFFTGFALVQSSIDVR